MNVLVKNRLHNNNTRAALNTLHFAIFLLPRSWRAKPDLFS
jgi:hypothetical protein